jgi:hypothetical protein
VRHAHLSAKCLNQIIVRIEIQTSKVNEYRSATISIRQELSPTESVPIYDNLFLRSDTGYEYVAQYVKNIKDALHAPREKKFREDMEKAKQDFWG